MIEQINEKFISDKKSYILAGPGRWGSTDPWLGIPVKWFQISAARVIIEAGLDNFSIDPSQGTHFFQNVTSFGVGYFTVNHYIKDGYYDMEYLSVQTPVFEDEYIRHIHFESPMNIMVDGRTNKGA